MTRKTFFICLAFVVAIWIFGYSDYNNAQPTSSSNWKKPESGKWCLGYDYAKGEYKYHTEYDPFTTPKQVYFGTGRGRAKVDLDRKNWTREQLKELESVIEELQNQSLEGDYDIEFYLD